MKAELKGPQLPKLLVELARAERGTEEKPPGSNCGPRVNEYKAATWLDALKPWPWCAAFICWLLREAMRLAGSAGLGWTETFKRPRTAGAWDFENWAAQQDGSVETRRPHKNDILPGDIVVFTFSHIGLAETKPDKNGYVMCIEGNTDGSGSREGGAVLRKMRHVGKIRSRLRITV